MIKSISGDILKTETLAIVNPVNCMGVMGKGLALQIKNNYPLTFISYSKACKENRMVVGKLHWYKENGKIIINFPTKNTWRENSKLSYIKNALPELIKLIKELHINSISIPPLGCGLGGLSWIDVKSILLENLKEISNEVDIYLYEPLNFGSDTVK